MNDEERRVSGRLFDSGKLHDQKWMSGKGFLDTYKTGDLVPAVRKRASQTCLHLW